jgi:hypothetical protein
VEQLLEQDATEEVTFGEATASFEAKMTIRTALYTEAMD